MTDDLLAPRPESGRRPWLLLFPCALVALLCALLPAVSLRALGAPLWLSVVAGAAFFPLGPLLWHLLAERGAPERTALENRGASLGRLAARSLAVGLLVLAVSLCNLGPSRAGGSLLSLVRPRTSDATADRPAPPSPAPAGGQPARHELEPFIPVDARSVLALSQPAAMRQLLAAAGADTQDKLAALQKCQILVDQGRILIAARDLSSRIIVVRAPGVTDPRNLYCLAGFLGSDRLRLRFTSDKPPVRFEVQGLFPQPLHFTAVDDRTVIATDGGWGQTGGAKLFSAAGAKAEGPLAAVLERVDRSASLWSASVFGTAGGPWDLAIDARIEATHLRLRGSSIPPSGPGDRAVVETSIPLAFASALPAGALGGAVAALAAAGGSWPAAGGQPGPATIAAPPETDPARRPAKP